jgi:hypothetical protein
VNRLLTGILVFPEVEVLDFCDPFEVFAAVRRDEARRRVGMILPLVGRTKPER